MKGAQDVGDFWDNVRKTSTCWEWTGYRTSKGYGKCYYRGSQYRAHRFIYEALHGPIPPATVIDHTCHNPACVNPDHLRPVTAKQNSENRSGAQANSRSGVRGVRWDPRRNKWSVACTHNHNQYWGGYFTDLDAAAEAASRLRLSLFTHSDLDRKAQ